MRFYLWIKPQAILSLQSRGLLRDRCQSSNREDSRTGFMKWDFLEKREDEPPRARWPSEPIPWTPAYPAAERAARGRQEGCDHGC